MKIIKFICIDTILKLKCLKLDISRIVEKVLLIIILLLVLNGCTHSKGCGMDYMEGWSCDFRVENCIFNKEN